MSRHRLACIGGLMLFVALTLAVAGWNWRAQWLARRNLLQRLDAVVPARALPSVPCAPVNGALTLLVLGQSNAGNHAAEYEALVVGSGSALLVFTGAGCQRTGDPLPGGTGRYASVWSRLPVELRRVGETRTPVVALLAVESTRVADWAEPKGPLGRRLDALLAELKDAGLRPDAVLWQQGEADALTGTPAEVYQARFTELRTRLRAGGVLAPILLARSTRCRQADGSAVRTATDRLIGQWPDVFDGPDTDALGPADRILDCHFSRRGAERAAALWADALVRAHIVGAAGSATRG